MLHDHFVTTYNALLWPFSVIKQLLYPQTFQEHPHTVNTFMEYRGSQKSLIVNLLKRSYLPKLSRKSVEYFTNSSNSHLETNINTKIQLVQARVYIFFSDSYSKVYFTMSLIPTGLGNCVFVKLISGYISTSRCYGGFVMVSCQCVSSSYDKVFFLFTMGS